MHSNGTRDPWTDNRPIAEREREREQRFAPTNDLLKRIKKHEEEEARAALMRFASGELTLGEIYTEYERWERHAAVLATYPEGDPRRDGGIAYAETRMNELAKQGNRILAAKRVTARHRVFETPNFDAARFADLVGLAELLGYHPRKAGRNYVMSCPWHGEDSTPSLTIYEPGLGWHCFGCGRGGQDAASFAAEHFATTQAEGLRWVLEMIDVPEMH